MNNIISYPKSIEDRLNEAMQLYRNEEFFNAAKAFKELVDDGCDAAFVYLGAIYASSRTGLKNLENAHFYYEKAVERCGYTHAYLGLVRIYLYGDAHLKNYKKALEYCEFLINECQDPIAYFHLGHIYAEGFGVEVDLEKAIQNFKKAWEGGYVFGLTFIGLIECKRGRHIRGWWYRLRAAWCGLRTEGWRTAIPTHWTLTNYKDRFRY